MISGLFFDFDGVLSRSFEQHFAAWKQILPGMGIEPDPLVIKLHEGEPAWRIAQAICSHAGKPVEERQARELADAKNVIFRAAAAPDIFPEIEALLDWAQGRAIKTAVVTGTNHQNINYVLGKLTGRFDTVIGEGDYQRGKPDPEPYLTAAKQFALPPQACMVIENAPMGIQAAKAAGIFCVALKTTLHEHYLLQADLILPDHRALLRWLAGGMPGGELETDLHNPIQRK